MSEVWLHKTEIGHLAPSDGQAQQTLKKLKVDQPVLVKITKPRNIGMHRKFFALMQIGFDNQEKYDTLDAFRKEVTMRAGWYKEHHHVTGAISYEAKSIAFNKMDELEFQELFYKCIDVILRHFMPGGDPELLKAEVERVSGFAI